MTRIIGHLVTKNEQDRYLDDCLRYMVPLFDDVFVYDDRSEDDTRLIAANHGCKVVLRRKGSTSFLEDESKFREDAWRLMVAHLGLETGDWVFSFDADEFLVGKEPRERLQFYVDKARGSGFHGIQFRVAEVFGYADDGTPLTRKDGFWGNILSTRCASVRPDPRWNRRQMGCGSVPNYVSNYVSSGDDLQILHFGYAVFTDRCAKYDRYMAMESHGHNQIHIDSIIQQPSLMTWRGPYPHLGERSDV